MITSSFSAALVTASVVLLCFGSIVCWHACPAPVTGGRHNAIQRLGGSIRCMMSDDGLSICQYDAILNKTTNGTASVYLPLLSTPHHHWSSNTGLLKGCVPCVSQREALDRVNPQSIREWHQLSALRYLEAPLKSSAPEGPWGHSLYSLLAPVTEALLHRDHRAVPSGPRGPRHTLPLIQSTVKPATFGLKFQKCAQVERGREIPVVTFFLVISNPAEGTDLSQLGIRDAVSDITLLHSNGNVQERGFQTFTTDSLPAGSQYVVNYTASLKGISGNGILALPAYLTFSNASQNDINLFGPVVANFTLRINATEKIYPSHAVHFAGFIGAFFFSTLLLSLSLLLASWLYTYRLHGSSHARKRRAGLHGDADPEEGACNIVEVAKEEAAFEDKIIDIMVLEDPQNMFQALDNLDVSTLLRGACVVESTRVEMCKAVMALVLGGAGLPDVRLGRRLLAVLHGQLQGMEGKLTEERLARMAALAGRCNLESREEMEAEHRREAAEKAQAELLYQHAKQQQAVECSLVLEKVHKLEQQRLQQGLMVRHEHASAQVQREMVLRRRVELHKIFWEELDEATRTGELEKDTARRLLHDYFTYQDKLEEVLDVFLANQRAVLGERHAQRRFLVQSLQSLKGLVCDVISSSEEHLESWSKELRREAHGCEEEMEAVMERAKMELQQVKQGVEEGLSRERATLHCQLLKRRRGLIAEKLQGQKQKQQELCMSMRSSAVRMEPLEHLQQWQSLLLSQSAELGELVNSLDEEAATDIRKVTMRVIQGVMPELRAVVPSSGQALLALGLPPALLQLQREPGAGELAEAQERLHSQGKAAARSLGAARSFIQHSREQELQQQRALRERACAFFRCVCVAQLALSEEDVLRLKLEFQKCMCRLDHCLVLPRTLAHARLHSSLTNHRKEALNTVNHSLRSHPDTEAEKFTPEAPCAEVKPCADLSDLQLFRGRLEDRIQIFEQERERESSVMEKVLEELREERLQEVQAEEERLAVEVAVLLWERAEKRSRALETHTALLSLLGLLVQELQSTAALPSTTAQSIHTHSLALEEAEQQLQKERAEWEELVRARGRDGGPAEEEECERDEEQELFSMDRECRMAQSLQGALWKRQQVEDWLSDRLWEVELSTQAMEDLKEQLELKRLYTHCDQDLDFAAILLKQALVPLPILQETLRLLLPALPEGELQSLTDALYHKPAPSQQASKECVGDQSKSMLVKLKESILHSHQSACQELENDKDKDRILKKRQNLLERLFSSSHGEGSREVLKVLVQEKPGVPETQQERETSKRKPGQDLPLQEREMTGQPIPDSGMEEVCLGTGLPSQERVEGGQGEPYSTPVLVDMTWDIPDTGERVFVFRYPPTESCSTNSNGKRRRKRNFLNFKKGSVAPQENTL